MPLGISWGTLWWAFVAGSLYYLTQLIPGKPQSADSAPPHDSFGHRQSQSNGPSASSSNSRKGTGKPGGPHAGQGHSEGAEGRQQGRENSHSRPSPSAAAEEEAEEEQQEEAHLDNNWDSILLRPSAPPGSSGEIARILNAKNWYSVLEISRETNPLEIKKAYRMKQLATHPDKNQGMVGALEASQRVNAANDTLSNEVRRKQYDMRLIDEEQNGPRSAGRGVTSSRSASYAEQAKAFDEFVRQTMGPPPAGSVYPSIDPAAYDVWGDAEDHTFHMACACGYDHLARKVAQRSCLKARLCYCKYCAYMGTYLPAKDNDVWFENAGFWKHFHPLRYIRAYRCVGSYVYDITEWCRCQGMLMDPHGNLAPTNVHYVPFKLTGAGSTRGGRQRAEKREKQTSAGYGFNSFKGGGVNSHKKKSVPGKKKR